MKILLLTAAIFISSLVLFSCKKDNPIPPEDQPQISLTLEDTSCTEAWLKLTTTNISLPAEVNLYRTEADGISKDERFFLSTTDTLLYVDSLLPNHSYNFHTTIQTYNISSNVFNVTTMDTTSHNFTWQTYTFGGTAGSCTLYDCAIINENDIWAVGEIYVADTSQNGYTMYNAIHWDGSQWQVKRISVTYNGNLITPPLYGICAFSSTDIWLSSGVPIHGDGINWIQYHLFDMGILGQNDGYLTKIWGESSANIYFVGTLGTIAHYSGESSGQNGQWSRIESGTDLNIGDIWGIRDDNGGYNKYLAADNKMLIINVENNLQNVNVEAGNSLSSIWGKSVKLIYTAGGYGLSLYKNYKWENINQADVNTIYCIRGGDFNNVFGLSSTYSILYFNGYNWRYIIPATNNIYYAQSVKNNIVTAVGWQGEKAVVTVIRRNN